MVAVTAIVMAVASVVSAGAGIKQAHDTKEAQEDANAIKSGQEKHADLQASRKRAKENRIARARLQQGAEATGTTGSSGELGGLSSLQTQLGAQQADQTSAANTANALSDVNSRLAKKSFFNQGIQAAASITSSVAGAYDQKQE